MYTLYLINPKENLALVLRELVRYGGLTGIQINWAKSIILPLMDTTEKFDTEYPIHWTEGETKYLGIWISRDMQELWLSNYGQVIDWLGNKILK